MGASPPPNGSAFPAPAGPGAKGRAGVRTGAVALPVPGHACRARGGGPCPASACALVGPCCSGCCAADTRAGQAAPRPQPAHDGIPAGAAGRPREPSPRRPQPRCVWEAGMGRRWQGTAGRFLLALLGLTLSGPQFRSSLEDGVH